MPEQHVHSRWEVLSTRADDRGRPARGWDDLVEASFGGARVDSLADRDISGTITRCRLGEIQVSTVEVDPHVLVRGRVAHPADQSRQYVSLCSVAAGEVYVDQDDRQSVAPAGSLIAFDGTREHAFVAAERLRMSVVLLPHASVGLAPDTSRDLVVSPWRADRGVGALVSQLLDGMARHRNELGGPAGHLGLGGSISQLAAALFAEHLGQRAVRPDDSGEVLLRRVQAYVREHLGDPRLDSALLARRHGVSLRYLQLLFREQGTSPARWIRQERLAACHRDLLDPRFAHLTVGAVGARWGLPDASHFSRLFRARYGVTPSGLRRQYSGCP